MTPFPRTRTRTRPRCERRGLFSRMCNLHPSCAALLGLHLLRAPIDARSSLLASPIARLRPAHSQVRRSGLRASTSRWCFMTCVYRSVCILPGKIRELPLREAPIEESLLLALTRFPLPPGPIAGANGGECILPVLPRRLRSEHGHVFSDDLARADRSNLPTTSRLCSGCRRLSTTSFSCLVHLVDLLTSPRSTPSTIRSSRMKPVSDERWRDSSPSCSSRSLWSPEPPSDRMSFRRHPGPAASGRPEP